MRVLVIGGSDGNAILAVFDLPGYAYNRFFTPIEGAVELAEIWTSTYGWTVKLTESTSIPASSMPSAADHSRR